MDSRREIDNHNGEYTPIAGGRRSRLVDPGVSVSASGARTDGVRTADRNRRRTPMPSRSPPMRFLPSKCSLQYVSSNFFQGLGALPVARTAVPRR